MQESIVDLEVTGDSYDYGDLGLSGAIERWCFQCQITEQVMKERDRLTAELAGTSRAWKLLENRMSFN